LVLVAFAVADYLVLPQIAGTTKAIHLLDTISPWWALTAVGLEALSLVSYSLITRQIFPDRPPSFAWLIRTDLTTLGVSHLLPGGAATSTALRYRLLREGGIASEDTAIGMAVEGVGSNLVLVALLWLALVTSIPLGGLHPLYVSVALSAVIVLAVSPIVIYVHAQQKTDRRSPLAPLARMVPARFRPRLSRAVRSGEAQLRQVLADKRSLRACGLWASGNWLLDAASLWVFAAAYGHVLNPDSLLVAYGIANVAAIVPVSPGGLGIIEALLIPSLVGFGTPRAIAVLAVVSWRLFNFWAPIPTAGLCYLSLRTERWRRNPKAGAVGA